MSANALKVVFMENNITISGGNNTLKHILSPQQYLLTKIISTFQESANKLVHKSFLEIGHIKSFSRVLYDFTSERDRQILKVIKAKKEAYLKLSKADRQLQNYFLQYDKDIRIKYSNSDLVDEVNDYLKNNTP